MPVLNTEERVRANRRGHTKPVHEKTANEMLDYIYLNIAEFVEAAQGGRRTAGDMESIINALYVDLDCWQNAQAIPGEPTYC